MTDASLLRASAAYGACIPLPATLPATLPDAADAETYERILCQLSMLRPGFEGTVPQHELPLGKRHAARMVSGCCCWRREDGAEEGEYSEAELKLRWDFSQNKACWQGSYWQDLWCWTSNCHPLLAPCCSHPLHPVSRAEHIFTTVIQAMFVVMISAMITRAKLCVLAGLDTCGDEGITRSSGDRWSCCLCHRVLLSWAMTSVPGHLGGWLYAFFMNVVFAQIVLGASCACAQDAKPSVRRIWEFVGHLSMLAFMIALSAPTVYWLSYNRRHGFLGDTALNFVINLPLSILGTTAVQTLTFSFLWHRQQKQAGLTEGYEQFYVTAYDYQAFAVSGTVPSSC